MRKTLIMIFSFSVGVAFHHYLLSPFSESFKHKPFIHITAENKKDSITKSVNKAENEFLGLYFDYLSHVTDAPYAEKNKKIWYQNTHDYFEFISIYKQKNDFYASFAYQKGSTKMVIGSGKIIEIPHNRNIYFSDDKFFEIENQAIYISFKYLIKSGDTSKKCPILFVFHNCKQRPIFNEGCGQSVVLKRLEGKSADKCCRYGLTKDVL